jgi:hypothetical protein
MTPSQYLTLKKKKNKYGAKRCAYENINFPSRLEMLCYIAIKSQQDRGIVSLILRQVPFDLPGGAKHNVDFMAVTSKGNIFIEAKGRDLALGKLKRQQVEELYKITIYVVKTPAQILKII